MIHTSRLVLALAVFAFLQAPPALADGKGNLRYSIMVSKFQNRSGWTGQVRLGDAFGAILTDSLRQTNRFLVIGEKDMRSEAIAEQDFGASGRTAKGRKTAKIGHMTPAQLLVKGEITHMQTSTSGGGGGISIGGFSLSGGKDAAEINVVIYVVDSTTGQVVASKKVVGNASRTRFGVGGSIAGIGGHWDGFKKTNEGKAVEDAVDKAVEFLTGQLEDIPWTGTVVMVKHGKVFINRGAREGVSVGQSFVVGELDEIRDPDTGELLDSSVEEVARIKVTKVKEKIAIAKVSSGNAGAVRKGMSISLP